jgi:hypothetical protein
MWRPWRDLAALFSFFSYQDTAPKEEMAIPAPYKKSGITSFRTLMNLLLIISVIERACNHTNNNNYCNKIILNLFLLRLTLSKGIL